MSITPGMTKCPSAAWTRPLGLMEIRSAARPPMRPDGKGQVAVTAAFDPEGEPHAPALDDQDHADDREGETRYRH